MNQHNLKVLVIENDVASVRLIFELLKEYQDRVFNMSITETLSESIDILNKKQFDVIILDLGLTDSQGLNTFIEINKYAFDVPIIIITGLEDEEVALQSITAGAQDYLIKGTFDGKLLARSMLYAIERKHNEKIIIESADIIENTSEAAFTLNCNGIVKTWNKSSERIYKHSANEIIGQSILTLIPNREEKKKIDAILTELVRGNSLSQYRINFSDKDNKMIDSLITTSSITNKFGEVIGIAFLAQDSAHSKTSEQLSAIQLRVVTALAEAISLYHAAHSILKTICESLSFKASEIWAVDSELKILRHVSSWNTQSIPSELAEVSHELTYTYGEGIQGTIWKTKKSYWTNKLCQELIMNRKELILDMGLDCCFGFPILYENEVLGVMMFFGTKLEHPKNSFMMMFEVIGEQIGSFIKRKRLEKDLLYLAHHDILTGLANRYIAEETLRVAIDYAKKHQTMVAFLYFDLDHFKNVNDILGNDKGDLLLQEVGRRLSKVTREVDLIARFGGDEFAIVLPGIHKKANLDVIAQNILKIIALPFSFDGKEFYLSASIGISLFPYDSDNIQTMIKAANGSMCIAKQAGRNNFKYSSTEVYEIEKKKISMELILHKALENNEFMLYYQPILTVSTDEIVGIEVLTYWNNSNGEIIGPDAFIPLIEQSHLILLIGEWILRTACNQLKQWEYLGLKSVSVNISVHQLSNQLIEVVKNILEDTGLRADKLILEITESMMMQRTDNLLNIVKEFNEIGVRVSIDDFGTGYSSLSYLKNFNIQYLKIDQSFIHQLDTNPNAASIVEAIIATAHALSMKTIAEGIETKAQLDFLKEKGCDEYQGFYYSKPLPADELMQRLGQR